MNFAKLPDLLRHGRRLTFVSSSLQEGQTKMICSLRTPRLGIVRSRFMVSPQEGHTRVNVLSGTGGMGAPLKTGGSATELSATDAWARGPLSVIKRT
jgi:hypothetical protein